jgi:putative RecB family exonuclease
MTKPFTGLSIPPQSNKPLKRRYSVTADVVAFRRCGRQYGAFRVYSYAPAHQTQLYFGTILHQVLDRCHSYYHGTVDPSTQGLLPDNGKTLSDKEIGDYFSHVTLAQKSGLAIPLPPSIIIKYFLEVEDGLKSRGIRAITPDLRVKAVRLLQYFNALEGSTLYARVRDTEHRLQADQTSHILHGVVDLLVDTPNSMGKPAECEIWDYKGTSRIGLAKADLQTYEFQMRVYAHLYQLKHGVLPKKVILYFLNELDGPTCPTKRPVNATLEVSLDPADIAIAIQEFTKTVGEIEDARNNDLWEPARPGTISEADCTICDLRWDCPTPNKGKGVQIRYP